MNTIKIEFEMPSEILKYISNTDEKYNEKVKMLMIYTLIKEGKISFGKGSEILGINKIDLITELGEMGIPYFDFRYEEIEEDLNNLNKII